MNESCARNVSSLMSLFVRRAAAATLCIVAVSLGSMTGSSAAPGSTARKNPFRIGRPLVIPHAGGDGFYPENTMIAWESSMAAGGDVVDIDVSMSADGVLIAFHDGSLERTTNGIGSVSTKPYVDLAKLDAGWQFKRNGKFPFRGRNVRIPTLETVLNRFPTSLVTLDVKDQRTEVALPICKLLLRLHRESNVYVGSDTNEQVMAFRQNCPAVRTSGTTDERRAMRAARDSGDTTFVTKQLVSQPGYLADDGTKRITAKFLAFSHSKDIAVLTWVVDDPKDMAELIDIGIDGLYTRRPDLMVKILREKGYKL
jgi:glycerophosphoryl diester phosphodiesterase